MYSISITLRDPVVPAPPRAKFGYHSFVEEEAWQSVSPVSVLVLSAWSHPTMQ